MGDEEPPLAFATCSHDDDADAADAADAANADDDDDDDNETTSGCSVP